MPVVPVGPDAIANSTTFSGQWEPRVAALANDRYVVTWWSQDSGDSSDSCIRARVFAADGTPVGGDFVVNATAANFQQYPEVTALSDGRFVIAWESTDTGDGSGNCVRAQIFLANGVASGTEILLDTTAAGHQRFPAIAALSSSGGFVSTWVSYDTGDGSGTCIRARVYGANGVALGNDFIVNATTTSGQSEASVTGLDDGTFVVAWSTQDPSNGTWSWIRARHFAANGTAMGSDYVVNSTTTSGIDHRTPVITALAGGQLAVSWFVSSGDGHTTAIRARVISPDGTAAGGDFIVNSTSDNAQHDPAITALADGRFMVTWKSQDAGDGSEWCIRARLFDADGTSIGSDFIVNSTTPNFQETPSIAALDDQRIVAVWGDRETSDIRHRAFDVYAVGLNERTDQPVLTLDNSLAEIDTAMLLARAVYGGVTIDAIYRNSFTDLWDDYSGYLATQGWQVLDAGAGGELGTNFNVTGETDASFFETGGLFDNGTAQALLARNAAGTLVLSFRGSDSGFNAAVYEEAFTGAGQAEHYALLRPLIEAALAYARDASNQIQQVIVTGHSLGGAMVDLFTAIDAHRFADIAGLDLRLVSFASPGLDPDVFHSTVAPGSEDNLGWFAGGNAEEPGHGYVLTHDTSVAAYTGDNLVLTLPSRYYIGVSNNLDRVHVAGVDPAADALAVTGSTLPGSLLINDVYFNPTASINEQARFSTSAGGLTDFASLALQNLSNEDIDYDSLSGPDRGFGAHHNSAVYWANVHALATSGLSSLVTAAMAGHLIFGAGDYLYDGDAITYPLVNDLGVFALAGSVAADFILGLEGDDVLYGNDGGDLLDGGLGNDQLFGEGGDDFILFDGADNAANIDGGNGFDTLVLSSGSTAFDLAGHHFEAARAILSDIGANAWDRIETSYNTSWQALTERVLNDDGTSKNTTFDTTGVLGSLNRYADYFSAVGLRTAQEAHNDGAAGTSYLARTTVFYVSGQANYIDDFIPTGERTSQEYFRADGSRQVSTVWDATGTLGSLDFYQDFFTLVGARFAQTAYYDGRVSGDGSVDYQTTTWTDGTFLHGTQQGFDLAAPGTALFTNVF